MKRVGIRFTIFALCLGLAIGLGMQGFRALIVNIIIKKLTYEAKKGCDCVFITDSIDVSYLRLSATAHNPRLESAGKMVMAFKEIEAGVGLSDIFKRIMYLHVDLYDGHANDVDPDSKAVKFVTSVSEKRPLDPNNPFDFDMKLTDLRIFASTIDQQLGDEANPHAMLLHADGVTLDIKRNEKDDLLMKPSIDRLTLSAKGETDHKNDLVLGKATADLFLTDDDLFIRPILLALNRSTFEASASISRHGDHEISGNSRFLLDSNALPLRSPVQATLQGAAAAGGIWKNPRVNGSFENSAGTLVSVPIGPEALLLSSVRGEFAAAVKDGHTSAELSRISASGNGITAESIEPLRAENGMLSGKMRIAVDSFSRGGVTLHGLSGTLAIDGPADAPSLHTAADCQAVSTGAIEIDDVSAVIDANSSRASFVVTKAAQGKEVLRAAGGIKYSNAPVELEPTTLTISQLVLGDASRAYTPILSGTVDAKGPLSTRQLTARGDVTIAFGGSPETVSGNLIIKDGAANLKASGLKNALQVTANVDFLHDGAGKVVVNAKDLGLEAIHPELECATLTGNLEYNFTAATASTGNGNLTLDQVLLGCAPYTLRLNKTLRLPVQRGALTVNGIEFSNPSSSITTKGEISIDKGFAVSADGRLEVGTLAGFLPQVDDIGGTVRTNITVTGPLTAPSIGGHIGLENGAFWMEAAGVTAERVQGTLDIDQGKITVKDLGGSANSGTFAIAGAVYPFDLNNSFLTMQLHQLTVDRGQNATLTFSGDLSLKRSSTGIPVISGDINLENGQFSEKFDLPGLVRLITENVISKSRAAVHDRDLPHVTVDVHVTGSRNLFLLTDFASGEFAVDLNVNGSLADPTISGQVKTLSGWVGLKNRRFDVTSGIVRFTPDSPIPTLELVGETYLPSRTGEYTLVLLEGGGPLSNPIFTLSSDQGLSKPEILSLLAQSGTAMSQTRANAAPELGDYGSGGLLEDATSLSLSRLFHGLTRIDSILIEPVYNQQTGAIEPALVAEKKLARRLNLRGESSLGGTESVSRAKLVYDLSRDLSAEGLVETDPTKRSNPLEANLIYTILARQAQFVSLKVYGNKSFNVLDLLEAMRISETSRVAESDLPRLETVLRDFYVGQGYREATVHGTCNAIDGFCKTLKFTVNEQQPSIVRSVSIQGDQVDGIIPAAQLYDLARVPSGQFATATFVEQKRTAWIERLRAEGYIGARVFPQYVRDTKSGDMTMSIELSVGKPVSFTFNGNTVFTAEKFLDTINLFSRKQPFGNNTIAILVENIEREYRAAGYLFATVSYRKEEDPVSGRINYFVSIIEEHRTKVKHVSIDGIETTTKKIISQKLAKMDPQLPDQVFSPHAAIAEDVEAHARQIQQLLVESGFPDAAVTSKIEPDENGDTATIHYAVHEGVPLLIPSVDVSGAPDDVKLPKLPDTPCSVSNANDFISEVSATLRGNGYLRPTVVTESDPATHGLLVHVTAGSRSSIRSIVIQGNNGVSDETILRQLSIHAGEPRVDAKLDESRRSLLKLGLFSRVDIAATEKNDDQSQDVVVAVVERPRQTLEVGVGANSEYGFHVFGEASDRGLFADGRSITARLDTYWDRAESKISQGVADVRFNDPEFLETPLTLTEDVRFQRLDLSTLPFNLDRLSLASYFSGATNSGVTYSFGHTISQDNLADVDPDSVLSPLDDGLLRLSFLSGTLSYDQRDNPLNPHSGYYGNVDYQLSAGAFGSDADFQALSLRGSIIEPLSSFYSRFRIAFNSRVASEWKFGDTPEVPISERYFLGGRTTVRGFKENSIGPRGADGSVIGGDLLVQGNSELRYLLTDITELNLFLDSGNVFLKDQSSDPLGHLRYSTGIGFRYISPIGPIGVDLGHPLDRRTGESEYRIHFTIGDTF